MQELRVAASQAARFTHPRMTETPTFAPHAALRTHIDPYRQPSRSI